MNKQITLNGKIYEMSRIDPDLYMDYLDLREKIFEQEEKKHGYTRAQFAEMTDMVCRLYGGQFTADELKAGVKGPGEIIAEFVAVEVSIGQETNEAVENIAKNFTTGV